MLPSRARQCKGAVQITNGGRCKGCRSLQLRKMPGAHTGMSVCIGKVLNGVPGSPDCKI